MGCTQNSNFRITFRRELLFHDKLSHGRTVLLIFKNDNRCISDVVNINQNRKFYFHASVITSKTN